MFKCPVCHHATFTLFEYTIKPALTGTVTCGNCGTRLHQPPRLRNAAVVLPFLVLFWPAQHFHLLHSMAHEFMWLISCSIIAFGLAIYVTKLEPTDPAIKPWSES